jgi:hypothetical protein
MSRYARYARLQTKHTKSMKGFKCFYCNQLSLDDIECVTHIDAEHPGKLHYPTVDFENRLYLQLQKQPSNEETQK